MYLQHEGAVLIIPDATIIIFKSAFSLFIQATNKQVDCMPLAFHGLLTAYKESVEPDRRLHTASYTLIYPRMYWSEHRLHDNQTAGDLLRL